MRLLFALLVTLAGVSCAATPDPAPFLSGAELGRRGPDERQVWESAARSAREIERAGGVLDDPELEAYATEILERLFPRFVGAFRVRILQHPVVNAITLADGSIYLFAGLVARMENEAQLASVLAHEGVHFTHRHTYAKRIHERGWRAGSSGEHGRGHEELADREGVQALAAAGYAPGEAVRALERLAEIELIYRVASDHPEATHPDSVRRVEAVRRLTDALRPEGRVAAEEYRRHTARVRLAAIEESLARLDHEFALLELSSAEASAEYPDHVDYFLGEAYRLRGDRGDDARAEAAYQRALERAADFAPTHRALGREFLKRGESERARTHLQQYLLMAPDAADRAHVEAELARVAGEVP